MLHPPDIRIEPTVLERFRSPAMLLLLSCLAVLLILAMAYANYYMDQAPHRLLKALIGGIGVAIIMTRPEWVLFLVPFAFPYIEWLPKAPVPMLNSLNMLMYALMLSWVGRSVVLKQRFLDPSPWNSALGAFLLWGLLSSLQGALIYGGGPSGIYTALQNYWMGFCGLVLFFLVYNNVKTMDQVKTMAFLYCIAAGFGFLGVLKEYAGFSSRGGRRVAGGLGEINRAATFFACATLFIIEMFGAGFQRLWQRLMLLGAAVGAGIGIVLPASRGAILAFAIAGTIQTVRAGPARIVIMIAFVGAFAVASPGFVQDRMVETWDAVRGGGSATETFNENSGGRWEIWRLVVDVIKTNPVTGVGFGHLPLAMRSIAGRMRAGHNLYLETVAEMGIIGLALLVTLAVIGLRHTRPLIAFGGFPRALGMGYRFYMFALVLSNIFGGRLYDFPTAGTWCLLTALVFRTEVLIEGEKASRALPMPVFGHESGAATFESLREPSGVSGFDRMAEDAASPRRSVRPGGGGDDEPSAGGGA